jgi:peptidoglycan/LPS O-acetylase OafA/YrhL
VARAGTWLASFSYSLYLVHSPLLLLQPLKQARVINAETIIRQTLTILALLTVAYLFSRCFETTGPWLKARAALWLERGDRRSLSQPI